MRFLFRLDLSLHADDGKKCKILIFGTKHGTGLAPAPCVPPWCFPLGFLRPWERTSSSPGSEPAAALATGVVTVAVVVRAAAAAGGVSGDPGNVEASRQGPLHTCLLPPAACSRPSGARGGLFWPRDEVSAGA